MFRKYAICLAVLLAAGSAAWAKSDLPPGNYILYYAPGTGSEQALFVIKIENKGDKPTAEVLDDATKMAKVESINVSDRKVRIVFNAFGRNLILEGTIADKDDKKIIGNFGDDQMIYRCRLAPTDKEKLQDVDRTVNHKLPDEFVKAQKVVQKVQSLRFKLRAARGDEAKMKVKMEIEEAQKEADEQAPLFREVIEKHADSIAVVESVLTLLSRAEKIAKPDEAAKWLKAADSAAEPYGTRFRLDVDVRCLSALLDQKGFEAVALEAAERAYKMIGESTSTSQECKVLKALKTTQEKAGKTELAKQTDVLLAKLELKLDREYLAKVPPFKPAMFPGRKEKSDKVVVMELFTGAQCPPCVAADVAFDGLLKAYKPSDLIQIQYHMHIPGPDPLTNPDTIARWDFYKKLFEKDMRGVPTALFNGKPQGGGGGGMANGESKFKQFQGIIDPLLDVPTTIKMKGHVVAKGDALSIKVDVDGIKEPNENLKLRLLLVEESIRYVGGNGIRFHHHVVRAMPGGAQGVALKEATGSSSAEVNLADLRGKLTKYLDNFVATEGPFSNPDRPLALKNLRVIALVQNDETGEILQALQLGVAD